MRVRSSVTILVLSSALLAFAGCGEDAFPSSSELDLLTGFLHLSTPPDNPTNRFQNDTRAVALGKRLFTDTRLSKCGAFACATCHPPDHNFVTNAQYNGGCNGDAVHRNAPTLLNAAFRRWLYWDGRKDSLWGHAILPFTRPEEMGGTGASLRDDLQNLTETSGAPSYRAEYQELFGAAPATQDENQVLANFGKVMAAYIQTLVKVDAPFDDDLQAFIAAAKDDIANDQDVRVKKLPNYLGLKTFVRTAHCSACHQGPMLSDDKFHNLGVDDQGEINDDHGVATGMQLLLADPFNAAGAYSDAPDVGRTKLDNLSQDLPPEDEGPEGAYKTASLRNVAISAPYMHNGSLATLKDVIDFYNRGGDKSGTFSGHRAKTIVKLNLTADEKTALEELLKSLTGREEPDGGW